MPALNFARLRSRIGAFAFSGAFTTLCRLLGPTLAGRLCARLVKPPAHGAEGRPVLFIVRDVAFKDLEQLRRHSARAWFEISQDLLYRAQLAWLPEDFFPQLEFQQRLERDASLRSDQAERFATALVAAVTRRHRIEVVLSSNVDYAQDEFVRRAAQAAGIPFVVLLKEHVNTAYGERAWSAEYRRTDYRYHGDAVAVFGERTREILVENGVCGAERIHVTGPPRMDAWAALQPRERLDAAVLCAFSHPLQEGAAAFPGVLQEFVALVGERPDLEFVVKCRDPYETQRVHAMLVEVPPGLTITDAVPMSKLLARAAIVAGFGSLALVEALYSPGDVVSLRFGGCTDDEDVQFDERDPAVAGVMCFAHSPAELRALVRDAPGSSKGSREQLLVDIFCEPRPTFSANLDRMLAALTTDAGNGLVR